MHRPRGAAALFGLLLLPTGAPIEPLLCQTQSYCTGNPQETCFYDEGCTGTGYKGVADDGWHTGYKSVRPYLVKFDGAHAGRFETVEQAAVQYARLEMGMPPLKC